MAQNCISLSQAYLETVYIMFVQQKEQQALRYLERFKGRRVIATLSGKDSLVALHLALRTLDNVEVVINKYIGRRRMPGAVVEELIDVARVVGAKLVTIIETPWGPHDNMFRIIADKFDVDVIVAGLRRQEDGLWLDTVKAGGREVVIAAPIALWRHSDVWAYIYRYRLPVPSLYCNESPYLSLQRLISLNNPTT